ncbi:MAG TPA: alpha/beta hydrolase, partial [Chitinophagaceae bacterium]|nr:alpha/beta hydrolase [Chitinophagaceae bacterium]
GLVFQGMAQTAPYCINSRFAEQDYFADIAIDSAMNVVYGYNSNVSVAVDSLYADVYFPNPLIDILPKRPLIVWVHGGGFQNGNRKEFTAYCRQLARRGYVAATISYRQGWNAGNYPCTGNAGQLRSAMYRAAQDVDAALRYLTAHASVYEIDTSRIFVCGQAEGAMSVLHAAFMDQSDADFYFPGCSADMGDLHFGSNTLQTSYSIKGIFNWCGAVIDTAILGMNHPIPVLSMHGLLDTVMPLYTGTYLNCTDTASHYPVVYGPKAIQQRLDHLGMCNETNFDASGSHCVFPSLEPALYLPSKFTCYFKNLLCGNCISGSHIGYNAPSCLDAAPTSVQERSQEALWSLIPKNNGHYQVLRNGIAEAGIEIRVFNILGESVPINKEYHISEFSMPGSCASGLYFLHCSVDNDQFRTTLLHH